MNGETVGLTDYGQIVGVSLDASKLATEWETMATGEKYSLCQSMIRSLRDVSDSLRRAGETLELKVQ